MSKIFFIADTHFDDGNILKFENRPFKDTEDMNTYLVDRWNKTVSKNDVVYVLGDVGTVRFIRFLNGTKYLIKGNHDTKNNQFYRDAGFDEVYDHPIIIDNFWILSHDSLYMNDRMPYANLFGHLHNSPIIKDYSDHHFCVSVERISYTPVDFEHIKAVMSDG